MAKETAEGGGAPCHGQIESLAALGFHIRTWHLAREEILLSQAGQAADGAPLLKIAVAATLANPYAGKYQADLDALAEASAAFGYAFGRRIVDAAAGAPLESYGKACLVGVNGEVEHGNALLTSLFADPVRDSLGGGKAWISSTGKRGAMGSSIDVPLAHKEALYVRSHYDTMTLSFADAPAPDEIVIIFAVATRGRLHARLGGLKSAEAKGLDGLR